MTTCRAVAATTGSAAAPMMMISPEAKRFVDGGSAMTMARAAEDTLVAEWEATSWMVRRR